LYLKLFDIKTLGVFNCRGFAKSANTPLPLYSSVILIYLLSYYPTVTRVPAKLDLPGRVSR